ncbi:MAG: hypothetical protein AAFV19_22855 [Pseudomonadota bacterium]
MRWIAFCVWIMLLVPGAPAFACGQDSRCEVEGGYYLVAEPEGWDGTSPIGVVVYFHGWNASPEGSFRNRAMVEAVTRRGALFVAPFARTGYWRQIGARRAEGGRDELAYIRAVMADIRTRWPIDPARTMTSGFSRGGSMSWNVACYAGDLFAAHAPIAGGFWGSTPESCPTGPVNMRHIHGLTDRVVAYDEIGIYNSMPIPEGMALLRALNGADDTVDGAHRIEHEKRPLDCERFDGSSGKVLEVCLHPRGHSIPAEWVGDGLDWLDDLNGSG